MKTTAVKNSTVNNKVNGTGAIAKTENKPPVTNGKTGSQVINNDKVDKEVGKSEALVLVNGQPNPQAETVKPETQAGQATPNSE